MGRAAQGSFQRSSDGQSARNAISGQLANLLTLELTALLPTVDTDQVLVLPDPTPALGHSAILSAFDRLSARWRVTIGRLIMHCILLFMLSCDLRPNLRRFRRLP